MREKLWLHVLKRSFITSVPGDLSLHRFMQYVKQQDHSYHTIEINKNDYRLEILLSARPHVFDIYWSLLHIVPSRQFASTRQNQYSGQKKPVAAAEGLKLFPLWGDQSVVMFRAMKYAGWTDAAVIWKREKFTTYFKLLIFDIFHIKISS